MKVVCEKHRKNIQIMQGISFFGFGLFFGFVFGLFFLFSGISMLFMDVYFSGTVAGSEA